MGKVDPLAATPTIVGLGASAGGLQALERFLGAIVPMGASYLVVQHLSPEHASILPQLLAAACKLPVQTAIDGASPLPDQVYVIPPNASLVIRQGLIRLEVPEPRIVRHPVDLLFASLAEELGPRGVAVVLSGTGSDGTAGVREVARAGGFAVVQSPAEAEYDGMPRNALATGEVDFVAPAGELPSIIARELRRREAAGALAAHPPADGALDAIGAEVSRITGRSLGAYKQTTLRRRVQRRLDALELSDLDAYRRRLETDPGEANALLSEMQIGVTRFFRDPRAFDCLARLAMPALVDHADARPLRVWVPGCATGEEAYSIAILLREEARRRGRPLALQLFATDVDETALDAARQGVYPASVAADVPGDLLESCFTREGDGYEIRKEIREGVIFSPHDVLHDPPFSQLDLVSCRNLLIYFQSAVQQRLLPLFHYALRPGGFLFLGSAEMVDERFDLLEPIDRKHRIYTRRESDRAPPLPVPIATRLVRRPPPPHRARGPLASGAAGLTQAALLAVLEAEGLAMALVDADGEARYFAGPVSRYLPTQAGVPATSLAALAAPELRGELADAVGLAASRAVEVRRELPMPGTAEGRAEVRFRPAGQGDLVVAIFRELRAPAAEAPGAAPATPAPADAPRVERSGDWAAEQLRSANEELQTMNEELQSANEELQVSQEELQSVNEELHTVNAELNRKVDELNELNADLRNLFQATRVPAIFLDRDLHITRFTPAATELLPVSERDLGRAFADLSDPFAAGEVLDQARRAMAEGRVIEHLRPRLDRSADYLVRALPYRRGEGVIDGAVLTFVDISELKRAEDALRESEERFRLLVDGARDVAIYMLSPAGAVRTWNPGASRLTGWTADEVLGRGLDAFFAPEDVSAGRPADLLARAAAEGSVDDEGWRLRKDGSRYWASAVISAIRDGAGNLRGFSKVVRDISDRRRMEEELRDLDRRKNEFLGVLSHELRNPLSAIGTSLYVIRRTPADREQHERAVTVAERQVRHLARLIEDLLDVTRITSGKIRLRREPVELGALARRVAEDHLQRFSSAGVSLRVIGPDEDVVVDADPARVVQMIGNLLQNAGKFTSRGDRVTLSVARLPERRGAEVSVHDTGAGIAPEVLERLFSPFVQAERLLDRNPGGLGLGLALVRGLAEMHGGEARAASDGAGRGATFVVRLPLADRPAAPRAEVAADVTPRARTILIVEDNPEAADSLAEALGLEGHRVRVARTGPEGVDAARAAPPEVVLCDIGLPGLDGYEVARALRSDPALRGARLIALSGYAQPEDVARSHSAGFDVHLAKPPDLEQLRRAIAGP